MDTFEDNYQSIPKLRRMAIFFTVIGPENSAEILKSFDDSETEAVIREMAEVELVDDGLQKQVLEEFSSLLLESATSVKGGVELALRTLETARGPHRARSMASKMGAPSETHHVFDDFAEMGGRQMWNLLKGEQSQTIALLLSAMDSQKTAEILDFMDEDMRSEVVLRMGRLNPTSSHVLEKIVRNLSKRTEGHMPPPVSKVGSTAHLAEVMKLLDSADSKNLLSVIESADAELGATLAKEMFSFKDLVKLSQDAMQRIMREVDTPTMVMAMKSASPELTDMIYGSLSKRGAEALKEELEMMGPARLKEVEAAQEIILQTVRKLEEDGEINMDGNDEDQYV